MYFIFINKSHQFINNNAKSDANSISRLILLLHELQKMKSFFPDRYVMHSCVSVALLDCWPV